MQSQRVFSSIQLVWITLAFALAAFMQVLDVTIANVAIPVISGNLGTSYSQATWIITSFGVSNAIALPITGWLSRRLGPVRLFTWSTILFVILSFLCGCARSLSMLIILRIIQGLVAGPLIPLSQSMLVNSYPQEKRNMALSFWSMTVIVAPICGPILGGWISDNWHWGWIFYINVPLGLLAIVIVTYFFKKEHKLESTNEPMDRVGLFLLVVGVGCLQLMLDRGKELGWFDSNQIIVLAIIALIGIIALVIWELTERYPIIDLSLFSYRNFSVGSICVTLAYMLYMGVIVLIPLLLQTVMGYSASWSGLAVAPIGILPLIISPLIGRFNKSLDLRVLVSTSFLFYSICFYLRSTTFTPNMTFLNVAGPQLLQGIAVACFMMPLTAIALSELQPAQLPNATSLFNFLRSLAGSIGISISTTLWSRREAVHHLHLTEVVNNYNPEIVDFYSQLEALGMDQTQASAYLAQQITNQGLILSTDEIFNLWSILYLVMMLLIWGAKSAPLKAPLKEF